MRVKLRPDAHYAPVAQGMYWSRAGRSFVLAGPPALYQLVDGGLGRLACGTSLDELVRDAGDEAARPILRHVLDRLLREDVLLDLDAVTVPAPDAATSERFAEVIAYLESHCRDPYRVFADLRGASVAVAGGGPAAQVAVRTLRSHGVEDVRCDARYVAAMEGCRVTLLIDDIDEPPLPDAAAPDGTLIAVYAGPDFALVGPLAAPSAHRAAIRARLESWLAAGPDGQAPRPLSAVLAGSLAAHAVLALLTGVGEPLEGTTLVHGRLLRTRQLGLDPAEIGSADRWESYSDPLALLGDEEPTRAAVPTASETLESLAAFTRPWTGPVGRGGDAELVQMPFSLATAELRDSSRRVAGWGENRAEANRDAVLASARALAGEGPRQPGAVAAAGTSCSRWLLDGALRCLADDLASRTSPHLLGRESLTGSTQRSLWSLSEDYFQHHLRAELYTPAGLDWCLVAVEDADGGLRVRAWGPDADCAIRAALTATAAAAQSDPDMRGLLEAAGPATSLLESLPEADVRAGLRQVEKLMADEGRRLVALRHRADPVIGELPLFSGLVWFA